MAQKVTLKQIANEVGLSPSSVSLVLNNRPCRISEENRRRIKEVAAREHYVPNQIARSLVMRESKTLGLIVPNIESRFFSSLAKNLEQRCRAEGYALFITNSDGLPENDLDLLGFWLHAVWTAYSWLLPMSLQTTACWSMSFLICLFLM